LKELKESDDHVKESSDDLQCRIVVCATANSGTRLVPIPPFCLDDEDETDGFFSNELGSAEREARAPEHGHHDLLWSVGC